MVMCNIFIYKCIVVKKKKEKFKLSTFNKKESYT